MYRQAIEQLVKWKSSSRRKPLIIKGARQVGKTWLVKEFAAKYYKALIYLNFEEQKELRGLFKNDLHIPRIIMELEAAFATKIDAGETLIFFDEIQEAENDMNPES